jgi:SAM-dependent methyltransferase
MNPLSVPPPAPRSTAPWYEAFFGEPYIATYRDRLDATRTTTEVDFLERALELHPGQRVLDTCCGHGRHAVELAARGYEVVGVDICAPALLAAERAARERGVSERVRFVRSDLRDMPFVESFDAAFNYLTSFGYYDAEAEDERALHAIACALRPEGRFMLETMNLYHVAQIFRPRDDWEVYSTGYSMMAERVWDVIAGRMHEHRVIRDPSGTEHAFDAHIRIYSPTELEAMFWRVGLTVEKALSAPDGGPCTLTSFRLAMVARKTG